MYGLLSFSLRICNLKSAFDMKCLIESFAFIPGRKDGSGRKGGWMMCVCGTGWGTEIMEGKETRIKSTRRSISIIGHQHHWASSA